MTTSMFIVELREDAFSRKWTLSDDMVVRGAEFQNGLLNISLEKVIPEEKNLDLSQSKITQK